MDSLSFALAKVSELAGSDKGLKVFAIFLCNLSAQSFIFDIAVIDRLHKKIVKTLCGLSRCQKTSLQVFLAFKRLVFVGTCGFNMVRGAVMCSGAR